MDKKNRRIFDLAFDYVSSFPGVTPQIIRDHFEDYKNSLKDVSSIEDIYEKMLHSPLSNVRFGHAIGPANRYKSELLGFSPKKIIKTYPTWKEFFRTIEKSGKSKIAMDIGNKKSYWYRFSHTVLDAANYLSRFDDAKDFREFVEKHIKEKKHVELIKTICEDPDTSVYGFGWPLACEFLKEIGYTDFIKMDSHLTAILEGLGVITATKGEEVYRQSIAFAESIEEKPFVVDKLFYLAGSGKVYLIKYHNTETNDKKVIKFIKDRL